MALKGFKHSVDLTYRETVKIQVQLGSFQIK